MPNISWPRGDCAACDGAGFFDFYTHHDEWDYEWCAACRGTGLNVRAVAMTSKVDGSERIYAVEWIDAYDALIAPVGTCSVPINVSAAALAQSVRRGEARACSLIGGAA